MISVIVIGKNEGKRLAACLNSISTALGRLSHEVIYVDSCSTDQSLQTARSLGARCYLLAERTRQRGLDVSSAQRKPAANTFSFWTAICSFVPVS